jgi:hypothetical protein
MTEKKETIKKEADVTRQIALALGVLSVVLAIIIILMAANVVPTVNSNRAARLINVGMGAQDNPGARTLHITGYVTNVGLEPAYHAQIHVTAVYTQGGEAIDTWVNIGNGGIIYGSDSARISTDVTYSAEGLGSWTITPAFSATP